MDAREGIKDFIRHWKKAMFNGTKKCDNCKIYFLKERSCQTYCTKECYNAAKWKRKK